MQQANENQARRDRSCFESLTLWDLKSHNHRRRRRRRRRRREEEEKGENKEKVEEEEEVDVEEEEEVEEEEVDVEEEEEVDVEEEEEVEEEEVDVEEEEEVEVEEEEEEETDNTYPRCLHHQGLKLSVKGLRGRQTGEEKYGRLREILGDQYVREVTCAPEGDRVVLHLYHPSVPMCSLLNHHFSHLATKFPECKFLMILAGQCVPNYPVSHLPTLFIYDSGCIINSLIGEKACGGRNVLEDELKWMLAQSGAFVIDSYEALYQESTPIMTPRSEQEQEDDSDDQSDHYDNQGAEV
ncbi:phosducin-like protein 3 [Oncorhynchus keta]|uniref:phosducin-like protein 3 n=1 Tax=Oncorhynchus keta TaxID=8018 RepID=UPI00227B6A7D|nr:phosducin-like protein 3 [Oncorhynchus keta]